MAISADGENITRYIYSVRSKYYNIKQTFRGLTFITSESCLLKPIAMTGKPLNQINLEQLNLNVVMKSLDQIRALAEFHQEEDRVTPGISTYFTQVANTD